MTLSEASGHIIFVLYPDNLRPDSGRLATDDVGGSRTNGRRSDAVRTTVAPS
jgi:hypothetical protein